MSEETIESLKAQLENIKKSQAGVDKAWLAEKRRADDLAAQLSRGESSANLAARLDRIEAAYRDRQEALELRYYAKERSLDAGVDWSLVEDYPFKDRAQVDAKLHGLASFAENIRQGETNRSMLSVSKPQAGVSAPMKVSPFQKELDRVNR